MTYTAAFWGFIRGVAERRSALLKDTTARKLFYPSIGNEWNPSQAELARCDAFILFFVAELENYFELTIEAAIESYSETYQSYFLKKSRAGDDYISKIQSKKQELLKNNNANWKKISPHFEFVGMGKESHFPPYYWDDIESIVSHRGHVAHNGARLRVSDDRREIFRKIELTIKRTRYFDIHFKIWLEDIKAERTRVASLQLNFAPPMPNSSIF